MITKKTSEPYVNAAAVLRRLAELEQDGVNFYHGLSEGAESEWVRKFAGKMVLAEQRHHDRFLRYAEHVEKHTGEKESQLSGPLSGDIVRLLQVSVFADREHAKRSARYVSDADSLRVAIRAEEHLALLMAQLRMYIPKPQRPYIDRVIKEEWGHKANLEKILAQRLPGGR
ncbi:MAG TPA: hypothetical protein PLI09_08555 [Candidatus Hydrogenedentes bacterium]|nr:hypothetical protein [Candidatus Hydrogenedentota bacterium]